MDTTRYTKYRQGQYFTKHSIVTKLSGQRAQHYSSRPLTFTDVPPLLVYILAHINELFLFIRYHALVLFFSQSRLSVTPRWLGQFIYMQPETLQYLRDIDIDDSRAREVLG